MNIIHRTESVLFKALLDTDTLRRVFCILFPVMQVLDGVSTILALKASNLHYELNPLLNLFLSINGNLTLTVMTYQMLTLIIILGAILLFDLRNRTYWKNEGVTRSLRIIYISGILLLVIWRGIFAVVPNLCLAFP